MGAEDIMMPDRMIKQINFMNDTKDAMLCGTNVKIIRRNAENRKCIVDETCYPERVTRDAVGSSEYIHPSTLCFRKSAIVDGYENLIPSVLQKYGCLYNLPDALVLT
jgi:hypothetical protein